MWPSRWLTGTSGSPRLQASVLAMVMPTSSEPANPGPSVTATASTPDQSIEAGAPASLVEHRDHPAQMGTGGHLGHDATGRGVQRHLAGDDVGDDASALLHHGNGCLVAGRLDREEAAAPAAHAPSASGGSSGTQPGSSVSTSTA